MSRLILIACVVACFTAACGDDAKPQPDTSPDTSGGDTSPDTAADLVEDTAADTNSGDSAGPDTADTADAADTSAPDALDAADTTPDDADLPDVADDASDTTAPATECRRSDDPSKEGLYAVGGATLLEACEATERCDADLARCVAAACVPGTPAVIVEASGGANARILEVCAGGERCATGAPRCAPAPVGRRTGLGCSSDGQCAGTDEFPADCTETLGGLTLPGKVCSQGCRVDFDCVGGHCGFIDASTGLGECLGDCPDVAVACTGESTCFDGDDDGTDECLPLTALPDRVGTACALAIDCGATASAYCVPADAFWVGGYCIQTGCVSDGDCQDGAHCGFRDNLGNGVCIASCRDDGTCARAGYGCTDLDVDGQTECTPSGTGTGTLGASCTSIASCAGGTDARCLQPQESGASRNLCTTVCTRASDCGDAGVCTLRGPSGAGACTKRCKVDGDCVRGQGCADRDYDGIQECGQAGAGPGAVGDGCALAADCGTGPRAVCLGGINFTGTCSAICTSDADCGAGHCVDVGTAFDGYCMAACTEAWDCVRGESCSDFDGDGRTECAPPSGGFIAQGDSCASSGDCQAGDGVFCAYPDQVCSRFCASDAQCADHAHCVDQDRPNATCRRSCDADVDCASPASCVDLDGDGRGECGLHGASDNPVGAPCGTSAYCDRDEALVCANDVPHGMCTRPCSTAAPCPANSHCAVTGDPARGLCVPDCDADADCRTADGFACVDVDGDDTDECLPAGTGVGDLGSACANVVDCAGGEAARCISGNDARGGQCTLLCEADATCGAGAHCATSPERGELCALDCLADNDCRSGWLCADIDGDTSGECVSGCTSDVECALDGFRPFCHPTTELCAECVLGADCASGTCEAGVCR